MDINQAIIKIDKYDYISFDVFDTLIKRNVEKPTDVFNIIEKEGINKYGKTFKNFANKRIKAESKARSQKTYEEITLPEIYSNFNSEELSNQQLEWAKEEEKNIEYNLCTINKAIKPLYDYCVNNNKKIEIISDIYLPELLIIRMLNKVGINKWDNLWISSKSRKTKATGNIYKFVLKELNISPNQMIHIGDNNESDIKRAREIGIDTIHIETHIIHMDYYKKRDIQNIADNIVREFINNNILSVPINQKLGFENMGPLLYGFSTWLLRNLEKNGIKKVYFMSRDGQIMKKAFDIINRNKKIESYYFYASRRVLQVPILAFKDEDYSKFINSLQWVDGFKFKYFLKSLGIENLRIQEKISKRFDIPLDHTFSNNNLLKNEILKGVFLKEIKLIKENASDELKSLQGYIKQMSMSGKVAIVDIGWFGNMQRNLEKLLIKENDNVFIDGYYMGVNPYNSHADEIKMNGYCFAPNYNLNVYNLESQVNSLFEQIFMADHGSVRRLSRDISGKYVPDLYPFEQTDENIVKLLTDYQNGALYFVKKIFEEIGIIDISSEFAISGVLLQFILPKSKDAQKWGNIVFKDVGERKFIQGNYYYSIFVHPKRFIKDYKNSIWREGYLAVHSKNSFDYHWVVEHLHKPRFFDKKNR